MFALAARVEREKITRPVSRPPKGKAEDNKHCASVMILGAIRILEGPKVAAALSGNSHLCAGSIGRSRGRNRKKCKGKRKGRSSTMGFFISSSLLPPPAQVRVQVQAQAQAGALWRLVWRNSALITGGGEQRLLSRRRLTWAAVGSPAATWRCRMTAALFGERGEPLTGPEIGAASK